MKSYLVLSLALIITVVAVYCESDSDKKTSLSSSERESVLSTLIKRGVKRPIRAKRRLQDVEKLMAEDEIMSMLICDACDKYSCTASYCKYCDQCILENSDGILGKLEKKKYVFY
ncbi:unnamed protein product [Brachionus calyciflorus]|uniref:Uncharacterized protein n=1 Tax=Brachionus calyciflorus TaxID=104777 RepID=A0A814P4G0_9BILA|nr:unnamed protein product [Brachionus calyciflorus]